MATLTVPSSSHFVSHPHEQQHPQHRAPIVVQHHHNPFEAFGPRHHSGAKSPSAAPSWRQSESVDRTPIATRPTPRYRRGAPSHSRTPSTSSESSTTSWRECSRSPAVTTVELSPAVEQPKPRGSTVPVYSIEELLALAKSPLVRISAESQAVVDNHVAHQVWRRGPHQGSQSGNAKAGRRHKNRGTSEPRSSSPSSASSTADDSERID